jgi:hypothetical protein
MKRYLALLITLAITVIFGPTASVQAATCPVTVASQITGMRVLSVKCVTNNGTRIMIAVHPRKYSVITKRGARPWILRESVNTSSRPLTRLSVPTLQVSTYNTAKDRIYVTRKWMGTRYQTTSTQREPACNVLGSDFFAVLSARGITCQRAQEISFADFPVGWNCKVFGVSAQYPGFDEGRCVRSSQSFSWVLVRQ